MTKSTGVGRGKGGGRPRKNRVDVAKVVPHALAAPVPRKKAAILRRLTMEQMREMAQDRAEIAINTLEEVAQNDERGSARVVAAKELLALAFGTPGKPVLPVSDSEKPILGAKTDPLGFLLQ